MLANYFRIAFRNIKKDKIFSFINIAGLAVGIACFLTLALFIIDELSFDKFYKDSERIYRVYVSQYIGGNSGNNSKTAGPLGPALFEQFPEVVSYTRLGYFGQYRFRYNDKVFNEGNIYGADSTFFEIFSLPFIAGDPKTALIKPNSIVMTETAAKRYFGNENPVGKILKVEKAYKADYLNQLKGYKDKNEFFLITGLIKDFPHNSHFSTDFIVSMSTYEVNQYWLDLWYSTYIKLEKGTDTKAFEKKLDQFVLSNIGPVAEDVLGISLESFFKAGNKYEFNLQPLTSIYLHSSRDFGIDLNTEWGDIKSSDVVYTYVFSAVALFILFIAVINFMNLATARSERRAKEVGIRKTLGSDKLKLIWQFISEAVLMTALAVVVSLALLELMLPLFNNLAGKKLSFNLFNPYTIPALICFIAVVGILAGSYPAFYLSSFRPVQVLKSASKGRKKSSVRSSLVVFQFSISITLLIGTIVIKNQLDYIQNKNIGFNKNFLFTIMNGNVIGTRSEIFKQELLNNPNIISASVSSQMFRAGVPGGAYFYNKTQGTDPISFQYVDADYDFLKTYDIKLKAGRYFSKDFLTDSSAIIVNEAALKFFNDANPIAKTLTDVAGVEKNKTFQIIGVIKDFNYESLHRQVRPLAIRLYPADQPANIITIRLSSGNIKETIAFIDKAWHNVVGEEGMWSAFVDENLAKLYEAEEKTGIIASVFTFLAIFIACLGLFGLAAFVTEQRTKEIGIRKVLGASVAEIVLILSKEFAVWVLLANLIAWPAAYLVMNSWLENFAYRINLNLIVFAVSGITALAIALLTVGMHAIKAAKANPVESLKYE